MSKQDKRNLEWERFAAERFGDEKKAYEAPQMSDEGYAKMKAAIERAKQENRAQREAETHGPSVAETPIDVESKTLGKVETLKSCTKKRAKNPTKHSAWKRASLAVAAVFALLILLPNTSATVAHAMGTVPGLGKLVSVITFRDYSYHDAYDSAEVHVGEIGVNENAKADKQVKQNAKQSAQEINAEVQKLTDQYVKEFQANLADEGYQDMLVKSENVLTTDNYFTLKLIAYEGAGSGSEFDRYYTIDLRTGKRLKLQDLFRDGADYIAPVSKEIKRQMKAQMAADPDVMYWLDSDVSAWNFKAIDADTEFYVNEKGRLVISFDEGKVAPMYMGVVTFEIPDRVIDGIRK